MKKQSLSRAAALLAASTLTVGLAATTATAATGRPVGGAYTGGPTTSPTAGPVTGTAKDRKVERLRKALARARAERADAYAAAHDAKTVTVNLGRAENSSKDAAHSALKQFAAATADLADVRAGLAEARTFIADTTAALAANEQALADAAAAHTAAINDRNTATALIDNLTADRPGLLSVRDAAATDLADVETDISWTEGQQIPNITTDLAAANAEANRLGPIVQAAGDTYQQRTLAYQWCVIPDDVHVQCLDNTGVLAERGEVTAAWGTYMDLFTQRMTFVDSATVLQQALTDAQDDLNSLNTLRDTRAAALTLAQQDLDALDADLTDAQGAVTAAQAEIAKQADLLDTLPVQAAALEQDLQRVERQVKDATAVETKRVDALAEATTGVNVTTTAHETDLANLHTAQQTLNQSQQALTKAKDRAHAVKDRLDKARNRR